MMSILSSLFYIFGTQKRNSEMYKIVNLYYLMKELHISNTRMHRRAFQILIVMSSTLKRKQINIVKPS